MSVPAKLAAEPSPEGCFLNSTIRQVSFSSSAMTLKIGVVKFYVQFGARN